MSTFSTFSVGIGSCSAILTHKTFSTVKNLCHFSVCKISGQNKWKHVIHYKFCTVLCVLNLKETDMSACTNVCGTLERSSLGYT
jgi:hypothetical protein